VCICLPDQRDGKEGAVGAEALLTSWCDGTERKREETRGIRFLDYLRYGLEDSVEGSRRRSKGSQLGASQCSRRAQKTDTGRRRRGKAESTEGRESDP
jgi:hypothetical protein